MTPDKLASWLAVMPATTSTVEIVDEGGTTIKLTFAGPIRESAPVVSPIGLPAPSPLMPTPVEPALPPEMLENFPQLEELLRKRQPLG